MQESNYTRNLLISFIVIICMLIIGSVYNIKLIDYFTKQSTNIYNHLYTVSNTVRDIKIRLYEVEIEIRDLLLSNDKSTLADVSSFIMNKEQQIIKDINILQNRYLGDKRDIEKFEQALTLITQTRSEMITLIKFGKIDEALILNTSSENKQLLELEKLLDIIIKFANNKGKSYFDEIQETSAYTFNITLVFAIFSIFFSVIISSYIMNTTKLKEAKIKRYFHMIEKNIFSLVFDLEENIVESSKALSQFLGMKKEDLLREKLSIIVHEENKKNDLLLTITNGFDWEGEIEYKSDVWLNIKVSSSLDENKDKRYSMILHDISDKKRIEQNLNIDQLTSLYNRRFFDDIMPKLLQQLKRNEEHGIFIMVDIDYFKEYNDFYGHPEGDEALKLVSLVLKEKSNRATDFVFRLGGEEFGIFIKSDDFNKAEEFVNKLRLAILDTKINHNKSSVNEYLTISLGAVYIDTVYDLKVNDIYVKADKLLYKAKEKGRNKYFIEKI